MTTETPTTPTVAAEAPALAPLTQEHHQPQVSGPPAAELPPDPDGALRELERAAQAAESQERAVRQRIDGLFEDLGGRRIPRFPEAQHTAREEGYRAEFRGQVEPLVPLADHAVALAKEEVANLAGLGAADLLEPHESFEVAPHAQRIAEACARLPIPALLPRLRAAGLTVGARPGASLLWLESARARLLTMEQNLRSDDWLGLNDVVTRLEARWAVPRRAQRTAPAEARLAKAEAAASRLRRAHWTGSGGPEQAEQDMTAHVAALWGSGIRSRE